MEGKVRSYMVAGNFGINYNNSGFYVDDKNVIRLKGSEISFKDIKPGVNLPENSNTDIFLPSNNITPPSSKDAEISDKLRNEIEKTKSEQGPIGKIWDGFKNLTGIGSSSDKAEQAIKDFEDGKISRKDMENAVKDYQEGQEEVVDTVADFISGTVSLGAFILATTAGIAAAPFTGGASLGLIAAGVGIATASGAASKAAIKKIDCAFGGREYNSFKSDLITGSINGILAPVTAGIGGTVGKLIAGKLGVTATRGFTGVTLPSGLAGTLKGKFVNLLLNGEMNYTGGTLRNNLLTRFSAWGVDNTASGGASAGIDYIRTGNNIKVSENIDYIGSASTEMFTKNAAKNIEKKSLKGFIENVTNGMMGGLLAAPLAGHIKLTGSNLDRLNRNLHPMEFIGTIGSKNDVAGKIYKTKYGNYIDLPTLGGRKTKIKENQDGTYNVNITKNGKRDYSATLTEKELVEQFGADVSQLDIKLADKSRTGLKYDGETAGNFLGAA